MRFSCIPGMTNKRQRVITLKVICVVVAGVLCMTCDIGESNCFSFWLELNFNLNLNLKFQTFDSKSLSNGPDKNQNRSSWRLIKDPQSAMSLVEQNPQLITSRFFKTTARKRERQQGKDNRHLSHLVLMKVFKNIVSDSVSKTFGLGELRFAQHFLCD